MSAASKSIAASRHSTSTKPIATVNGSRSAATSGGKSVQHGEDRRDGRGAAEAPDLGASHEAGGQQERQRGHEPSCRQAHGPQAGSVGAPCRHALERLSRTRRRLANRRAGVLWWGAHHRGVPRASIPGRSAGVAL